jgi:hypothetical protein
MFFTTALLKADFWYRTLRMFMALNAVASLPTERIPRATCLQAAVEKGYYDTR